jgi:hypothetical protein
LESHARSVAKSGSSKNASEPICELLTQYGFDVHQDFKSTGDNRRSVATYTHLRNALFHNSNFTCTPKDEKGTMVELKLFDYLPNIQQLVPLVILKAVGFDGYMNWDRWINMQN